MLRLLSLLLVTCSLNVLATENAYRLGAGDLISISVYDEPDLSLELRIGLSGTVSYPLLGDIEVTGLSPKELEIRLVERLRGPYLVDPSVTVSIMEYRPFYVTGEVRKPGSYSFHPGLTIDRAISIAGGLTERASKNKIFVVHDLSVKQVELDGGPSIKKNRANIADVVRPGDVITVEQGFF
ncbi:MAG: polysaccharide export protein [Thalassolituus maritimus]|uniref:Polysaccharide export outer membrane protein n=1 Tax=Thalassolituus maritimus TaxID=484498 RepID=A0A1N7LME3_9GAMM|nr:polysaccharide biosynthesis/export family protein [Thalassolituus maritimus]TPD54465.1 MAG: polysaccharide export protein [Thalassolituus maritimus]SIS74990.1 polysaccharide export outer membrane protein [Thalassolituus maritimus]